ncbi:hypothetical protein [Zhihengliuella halotolerans]|uniref:hypothetical protein n=1 Tax=Zhihengliuella halotolerans TaxID=370736 RepID=UPI000C80605F|nr:hypothetical protein [Zhihengliuella halotolerans]
MVDCFRPPTRAIVDLTPDSATVYIVATSSGGLLSSPKVVSPWLTYRHIDGDLITYSEVTCTGQAVTEASGQAGDEQVLWDDIDPWIDGAESVASSMKRPDTTIRVGFTTVAANDIAALKDEFARLCPDAAETVSAFVLG